MTLSSASTVGLMLGDDRIERRELALPQPFRGEDDGVPPVEQHLGVSAQVGAIRPPNGGVRARG
jgi:hypothetical protein